MKLALLAVQKKTPSETKKGGFIFEIVKQTPCFCL